VTTKPRKPRNPKLHTLATLANFLREDGDCLLWTGCALGAGKTPAVNHGGKTISARYLVALLHQHPQALQQAAGKTHGGVWRHTCGNPRCVAPEHAQCITRSQHMRDLTRRSNTGTSHAIKTAKITATRRARDGKIKTEDIPAILHSGISAADEAARRGVDKTIIWRLRARDATKQVGNVFFGLGART
jgi:hypothetical protein